MSWAAHDLEPYLARLKTGGRVSISLPFCLLGSYMPDLFTKWAVYGFGFDTHDPIVADPIRFHRGWPGAGFMHTPFAMLTLALLLYLATRQRLWAGSFLLGGMMHVLSDTLDTVGVMLFFPFTTRHVEFGAWAYVGEAGRRIDAVAYNLSLGGLWDLFWVVSLVLAIGGLSTRSFRERVVPSDPLWPKVIDRFGMTAALTLFRTSAFFGICAPLAWMIWALYVNDFHPAFDWRWGGPGWAPPLHT